MGYSVSDSNIKNILSSVKKIMTPAKNMSIPKLNNIFFVEWNDKKNPTPDSISSEKIIDLGNGGVNYLTIFPDSKENLITAIPRQSLGYSTAKTSNYDLELLDLKIPGLIKGIVEKAKEKSQNSDLFSKGQFYYYPQETCFKFGIIDSQENLRPLFEFSSTDLWKNIFSNSTKIKITVFS